MRKIGLGIIGLGNIGKVHFKNSFRLKNACPVAVCDTSKKALRAAMNAGVKKVFTDYNELLMEPDVEAVVIALPTHLHHDCALSAAEAGKHILLEKPIARNVQEAKQIVSASDKSSVKLMIGYPLRFDRKFRDLKEKVEKGLLGEVEVAHAVNISYGPFFNRADSHQPTPVPDWWFKKELTGGGALVDLGSHMINLLRWYFGEIADIRSSFGYRYHLDFEDSANCLVKFKKGTLGIITVGWFSQKFLLHVEMFGSVGSERTIDSTPNPLLHAARMLTTGTSHIFVPHLTELQHFVNCLLRNSNPSPSGQDGVKDMEAITNAYRNTIKFR